MGRALTSDLCRNARVIFSGLVALALGFVIAGQARAVPAFAIQTGAPCQACHVGGFGPQLTPYGREFKLNGYTARTNSFNIPLSAMVVASDTWTAKGQTPPPAPGFGSNGNLALDQVSLFIAGGLGQHVGAFIQTTYDGVAKAFHWDNLDLRLVDAFTVRGARVVVGASLNNAPTVDDAWNTLPAWGYPYTNSALAPQPSASPLLNGALAQTTLGVTSYAWINSEIFIEGGAYGSPAARTLTRLGVDPTDPGSIQALAPYGRVALQQSLGPGTYEVGAFGMRTRIYPGLDHSTGFTDLYTDLGLDGSYIVTLKTTDVITFNARYLHEHQSLDASCALAGVPAEGCAANTLTDLRADASYYWRNRIGFTVSAFDTFGSSNSALYAANRTLSPNSGGVTFQLDDTFFGDGRSPLGPRFNMRVGLQYTAYTEFDGAAHNYDNFGHNASDNNTIRVFTWLAY
jgi:hypothetical protein